MTKNYTKIFWFMIFCIKLGPKPLRIRFVYKIDGCIRIYDGTRYLVLLGNEKYDPYLQ